MTRRLRTLPCRGAGDDGVAMVMAMMVILLAGTLTLAIAAITITQIRPTELLAKNVQTVHGAEAGIDAGLGRLRSASINGTGVRALLPCNATTAPSGHVVALYGSGAQGLGGTDFEVTIRYYIEDPAEQGTSWRAANALTCTQGSGPASTPAYALVESIGLISTGRNAASGNRRLESVYFFARKLTNIDGGQIHIDSSDYCLAADSVVTGAAVTVQLCDDQTIDDNLLQWAYLGTNPPTRGTTDAYPLALALVPSFATSTPLCVTAENGAQQALATLQPCSTDASPSNTTLGKLAQQWSYDDPAHFEGAATDGGLNNLCLTPSVSPPTAGAQVQAVDCGSAVVWRPEASVGAGQAGSSTGLPDATGQLVNYKEFGRCFDITSFNINAAQLIDYPCKQAPDTNRVAWNQRERWNYDPATGTGDRTLAPIGGPSGYCLDVSGNGPTGTRLWVVFTACNGTATQTWDFTGLLPGNYAGSYLVRNLGLNQCLGVDPGSGGYGHGIGTLIVEACDGRNLAQKWNAPANLLSAGRDNTREDVGSSPP